MIGMRFPTIQRISRIKNKPKNGGTDTLRKSISFDVLIRIANTFDRLGSYRAADQLTTQLIV